MLQIHSRSKKADLYPLPSCRLPAKKPQKGVTFWQINDRELTQGKEQIYFLASVSGPPMWTMWPGWIEVIGQVCENQAGVFDNVTVRICWITCQSASDGVWERENQINDYPCGRYSSLDLITYIHGNVCGLKCFILDAKHFT